LKLKANVNLIDDLSARGFEMIMRDYNVCNVCRVIGSTSKVSRNRRFSFVWNHWKRSAYV